MKQLDLRVALTAFVLAASCSEGRPPGSLPDGGQSTAARQPAPVDVDENPAQRVSPSANGGNDTATQATATEAESSRDVFYRLLNLSQSSYVPLSAAEMVQESDIIVRGTMVAVTDGPTRHLKGAKFERDLHVLVVAVRVNEVVKGAASRRIHVRFIHGGAVPLEIYSKYLPTEELSFFLVDRGELRNTDSVEYLNKGQGYPAGETLYMLTTPQGLVLSRDGQQLQPLAPNESLGEPGLGAQAPPADDGVAGANMVGAAGQSAASAAAGAPAD